MQKRRSEGWWRGVLLLAGLLVLVTSPGVALQTTIVRDTVYRADGTPAQGTLLLSWPPFTAVDGSAVAAGNETLTIGANGAISVALTPNAGATPMGSYYTAVFHLNDGTVQREYWVVPQGGPTTLSAIRSNVVPAAVAQTWSSQASINAALDSMQSSFLPLKGGAVSGPITLPADPSAGLQAATKQYVDSRTSLPTNAIPYQGSTGVVAATFDKIVAPFHSTAYVPGMVTNIGTAFNEGAAGAGLIGTRPATDVPGSAWVSASGGTTGGGVFISGSGAQFGPANGGSSTVTLLDTGKADFTWTLSNVHLSGSASGGFQVYARANHPLNAAEVIQWNPGGMVAIQDATGSGSPAIVASAQTSGLTGDIVVTVSGQTITVNWFGTVISGTIPTSTNSGNTFIGFNPNGSLSGSNDWVMTVGSINVLASGMTPTLAACNGIVQSDGSCGTVVANQGVATDASGHATTLPELGTRTDSQGNTAIAWQEDRSRGIYDPRRPSYWVNGSMTDPGSAKNLATQVACDLAMGKISGAEVRYPQGTFYWDALQLPPGSWWHGVPNATGGTTIQDAYNGRQVGVAPPSMTVTCADGKSYTLSGPATKVSDLSFVGCSTGGCGTAPAGESITTLWNSTSPLDLGFEMQASGGVVQDVYTQHFSGFGLRISGKDTKVHRIHSYGDDACYYFCNYSGTGDTGGVGGTGWHGAVEFTGADVFADYIEAYGYSDTPTVGNYLHIADIITGGGLAHFDHLWPQLGPIGIAQPYGIGSSNVITNSRVDFARAYGVWIADAGVQFRGGLIDGSCTGGSTVLSLNTSQYMAGTCEQFFSSGAGTDVSDVQFTDNPAFGATVKTADLHLGNGQYHNIQGSIEKIAALPYGQNINFDPQVFSVVPVTGPTPSVDQIRWINPSDMSANTITGFMNVMTTQDFFVQGGNANVTIQNNARVALCAQQDVNLGSVAGFLHFRATGAQQYGATAAVAQICEAGAYLPLNGGALAGPLTAPKIGGVFQVDQAPSSCTIGGKSYTTQINCAVAIAANWVTTNNQSAALQIGQGLYQNCQAIQLPATTSNSLSLLGATFGGVIAGVTIQQSTAAGCNTTQPVITQPYVAGLNNQEISKITIDGNHVVECADIFGTRHSTYDINCLNPKGDHGIQIGDATNLPYEIRVPQMSVRTATYGGAVTYPTFTVQLTGGAVSGWTVTNSGSFPSYYQLVSYIAPGTKCTTPPSAPTIQTSAPLGGFITVTGLTTGASAGVGCTAVYVQVYQKPEVNYGIITNTTDSTFYDMVVGGPTFIAGIQNNHGDNTFVHPHVIGQSPTQIEDHGRNKYYHVEADSAGGYGFSFMGSRTAIHGWTSTWNANVYSGAGDFYLAGSQVGNALFDHTCPGTQTAGGYNEINTSGGAFTTGVAFPPGLTILGPNELCDGSGAGGWNYQSDSVFFGGVNASKLNIYADNSSASIMNLGSGANVTNSFGLSGARLNFTWNASTQTGVVASKAIQWSVTSGTAGGISNSGQFYQTIGTAIASAGTIAPTGAGVYHVTGTAAISTMTVPAGCTTTGFGCRITLWPDGLWTIATGGNFLNASTAVIGRPMDCTYDPAVAKWACSY